MDVDEVRVTLKDLENEIALKIKELDAKQQERADLTMSKPGKGATAAQKKQHSAELKRVEKEIARISAEIQAATSRCEELALGESGRISPSCVCALSTQYLTHNLASALHPNDSFP
jgi:hypothetical protein